MIILTDNHKKAPGIQFKIEVNVPGVFEPPIDGVYLLTVYANAAPDQNGLVIIRNNDIELCRTYVAPDSNESSTCTAITQLAIGDSV